MAHTGFFAVQEGLPASAGQAVLECLSVTEGADALFLARQTGLRPGEVTAHVRELASAGYIGAASGSAPLLQLTDRGRAAHGAARRWRFRAGAVVLCAHLSARRLGDGGWTAALKEGHR
jgi:DNA-binding MarR family transcriptional regulator